MAIEKVPSIAPIRTSLKECMPRITRENITRHWKIRMKK